jgi:uncharacterized protein YllA (UPF0747 family)
MLAVTRPVAVRARVAPRSDPPFDRLEDPIVAGVTSGGPIRDRMAGSWMDDAALRARLSKRAAWPQALANALREQHVRLGASAASLAALDALARGEATCAIAGQQPGLLGGPLYGLHKAASAVGIAKRVAARTGVPCVPVYWNHVEDSDFEEIRGATLGDAELVMHDLALPHDAHVDSGLVGDIALDSVRALVDRALAHWNGLPGRDAVAQMLESSLPRGRDLGEAHAALFLALFQEAGLVVIDPRLPEFRAAARRVIDRYLDRPEALTTIARSAGADLEKAIGRRPLNDAALDSFVFAIDDGRRRKVSPQEARGLAPSVPLSPSVALRPVVQDAVLPTVAMACGPGELAYLAQLSGVFDALGVTAAIPVPRFGATWLPTPAVELIEATGADPWMVVAATDQVLRRHAEARVPEALTRALQDLRGELEKRLAGFSGHARELDPSFPQMVESARSKIDYQIGRLSEGLVGKARHKLEREHPSWLRLRYYLLPGDKLQERRLASLEPIARRDPRVVIDLCDLAEQHAASLERGEWWHALLELA